jgi:hypothetical protein
MPAFPPNADARPQAGPADFDVLVVGSGFGGFRDSVAAEAPDREGGVGDTFHLALGTQWLLLPRSDSEAISRRPDLPRQHLSLRHWSEQTIIALVMQSWDNSITCFLRRGLFGRRLSSPPGHDEPNPDCDGLQMADGSAVSANLGANPALTITTQAERAMALWPNKGEPDPRPPLESAYSPVAPTAGQATVPAAGEGEAQP